MFAVQVGPEARAMLRPVRTKRALELGLDAALVLQMAGEARVVVVQFAAIAACVGDALTVEEATGWATQGREQL